MRTFPIFLVLMSFSPLAAACPCKDHDKTARHAKIRKSAPKPTLQPPLSAPSRLTTSNSDTDVSADRISAIRKQATASH